MLKCERLEKFSFSTHYLAYICSMRIYDSHIYIARVYRVTLMTYIALFYGDLNG